MLNARNYTHTGDADLIPVIEKPIDPPIKLSRVSKLDGIRSWSLPALETCPGAVTDGELVPVCKGCYARSGHYRFRNVADIRAYNKQDCRRSDWVPRMVATLDSERYLRWFDSGDIFSVGLAKKIYAVCQQTPWVKHWIPTRSYKIAKIRPVLDAMNKLSNVVVRFSSDSIDGEFDEWHGSIVVASSDDVPEGASLCRAHDSGRCNGCRQCWDKSVDVIAYVAHGATMRSVIDKAKT